MRRASIHAEPSASARLREPGSAAEGLVPAVGVVADGGNEARLIQVLERGGLLAFAPSTEGADDDLDVLVVRADSPSGGKDEIARLRDRHQDARLVLVAAHAKPADTRLLLGEGVPGLVLEEDVEAALAPTVRSVFAGQISYPAELMPTSVRAALSKREKQILGMVVMGFTNAEIAAKLFISESTVKSHLSSAFATLGVRSRKEATALILDPHAGLGTGILAITGTEKERLGEGFVGTAG